MIDTPVVDAAATSAARTSWQQRKDEAATKGEAFSEPEPAEARHAAPRAEAAPRATPARLPASPP